MLSVRVPNVFALSNGDSTRMRMYVDKCTKVMYTKFEQCDFDISQEWPKEEKIKVENDLSPIAINHFKKLTTNRHLGRMAHI
jgi:hypothetical protein